MTQKLFSTGPGTFRRAERKEATDGFVYVFLNYAIGRFCFDV